MRRDPLAFSRPTREEFMPASVGRVVTAAARVLQRKETSTSWVARNFVSDARHRSRRELIPVIVIYIAGNSGSAVENGRRVRLLSRKLPKRDREGGKEEEEEGKHSQQRR